MTKATKVSKAKNVAVTGTGVAVMGTHYAALATAKVEDTVVADKLAAMLANANTATEVVADAYKGVKASSSKNADGTNKQKRNSNVLTRKIAVFTSASANACFIATNLAFCAKTNASAIAYAKRDKALVKRASMFANADLVLTVLANDIPVGATLADAKAQIFDKYAQTYNMQCKRGTGNANVTTATVADDVLVDANELVTA